MRTKEELNQHIQGTDAWLDWRRLGIGASETPCLMGESDFDTPYSLYLKKLGLAEEKTSNFAMQRGTDAEPKIRALYELHCDLDMPASLVVHPDLPFVRASLDAYNAALNKGAEFKYVGEAKHQEALQGKVPQCYYGQVQHQMFVTGAETWDYVSFDGHAITIVPVKRDEAYIAKMLPILKAFWYCVENKVPPSLTDKDSLELTDAESVELFTGWKNARLKKMQLDEMLKKLKEQKSLCEDQLEDARRQIAAKLKHPKVLCAGVQVITKSTGLDIRLKDEK